MSLESQRLAVKVIVGFVIFWLIGKPMFRTWCALYSQILLSRGHVKWAMRVREWGTLGTKRKCH